MIRMVRDVALRTPVMVQPQDEIRTAEQLLLAQNAGELYVVDESERLLGFVPDYEILNYRLLGGDGRAHIAALMSPVLTLELTDSIDHGARLLKEQPHACLPVVQEGRLIGQFCRSSLLRILAEAGGATTDDVFPALISEGMAVPFANPAPLVWKLPGRLRGAG